MSKTGFTPVRVSRTTAETAFAIRLAPASAAGALLDLPNRLLSHFIDHFAKASGVSIEVLSTAWPRSWAFDHVLCEDLGQLIGQGVSAIAEERRVAVGIPGRASTASAMDDCASSVMLGFESRPRCDWRVPRRADIDGFVDSWYDEEGQQAGSCFGTNLRQFFDGFTYGSGASLRIEVQSSGNLHHLYETVFRNLGDAVAAAVGIALHLPGESSGLAGPPAYEVTPE